MRHLFQGLVRFDPLWKNRAGGQIPLEFLANHPQIFSPFHANQPCHDLRDIHQDRLQSCHLQAFVQTACVQDPLSMLHHAPIQQADQVRHPS